MQDIHIMRLLDVLVVVRWWWCFF